MTVESQLLRSISSLAAILLIPKSSPPSYFLLSFAVAECLVKIKELLRCESTAIERRVELARRWRADLALLALFAVLVVAFFCGWAVGRQGRPVLTTELAQDGLEEGRGGAATRRTGGGVVRRREDLISTTRMILVICMRAC